MEREWIWQAPGVDGHYPNGAWFLMDKEETYNENIKRSYKLCQGTIVESTIEARKGTFYTQFHGYNRPSGRYYPSLEEAKKAVEEWANKPD